MLSLTLSSFIFVVLLALFPEGILASPQVSTKESSCEKQFKKKGKNKFEYQNKVFEEYQKIWKSGTETDVDSQQIWSFINSYLDKFIWKTISNSLRKYSYLDIKKAAVYDAIVLDLFQSLPYHRNTRQAGTFINNMISQFRKIIEKLVVSETYSISGPKSTDAISLLYKLRTIRSWDLDELQSLVFLIYEHYQTELPVKMQYQTIKNMHFRLQTNRKIDFIKSLSFEEIEKELLKTVDLDEYRKYVREAKNAIEYLRMQKVFYREQHSDDVESSDVASARKLEEKVSDYYFGFKQKNSYVLEVLPDFVGFLKTTAMFTHVEKAFLLVALYRFNDETKVQTNEVLGDFGFDSKSYNKSIISNSMVQVEAALFNLLRAYEETGDFENGIIYLKDNKRKTIGINSFNEEFRRKIIPIPDYAQRYFGKQKFLAPDGLSVSEAMAQIRAVLQAKEKSESEKLKKNVENYIASGRDDITWIPSSLAERPEMSVTNQEGIVRSSEKESSTQDVARDFQYQASELENQSNSPLRAKVSKNEEATSAKEVQTKQDIQVALNKVSSESMWDQSKLKTLKGKDLVSYLKEMRKKGLQIEESKLFQGTELMQARLQISILEIQKFKEAAKTTDPDYFYELFMANFLQDIIRVINRDPLEDPKQSRLRKSFLKAFGYPYLAPDTLVKNLISNPKSGNKWKEKIEKMKPDFIQKMKKSTAEGPGMRNDFVKSQFQIYESVISKYSR